MPQRHLKNEVKQKPRLTLHQTLLLLGVLGMIATLLTFVTDWPYSLATFFGLDAEQGISKLIEMLRYPALMFFLFLTIYAGKRSIEEYQQSFEIEVKKSR